MSDQEYIQLPATAAGPSQVTRRPKQVAEGSQRQDRAAQRETLDRIFGDRPRRPWCSGKYVWRNGKWQRVTDPKDLPREHDNGDIRSLASGVHPDQIPEAEARFGRLGVTFDRRTGDAIYESRRAKLRVLKARGYHDNDEVRG
jgi:hypothetical protein